MMIACTMVFCCTETATTSIYTLSLHDALPISGKLKSRDFSFSLGNAPDTEINIRSFKGAVVIRKIGFVKKADRKSTRLNSSHSQISYAVFCLKKKNKKSPHPLTILLTAKLYLT